jgi:Peptidase family S58
MLPHSDNLYREKVPAAIFASNGFGKLVGPTQVDEMGEIETPILLTSTTSVPRVADALISYMLALPGDTKTTSGVEIKKSTAIPRHGCSAISCCAAPWGDFSRFALFARDAILRHCLVMGAPHQHHFRDRGACVGSRRAEHGVVHMHTHFRTSNKHRR